jgi:hypothetical protein
MVFLQASTAELRTDEPPLMSINRVAISIVVGVYVMFLCGCRETQAPTGPPSYVGIVDSKFQVNTYAGRAVFAGVSGMAANRSGSLVVAEARTGSLYVFLSDSSMPYEIQPAEPVDPQSLRDICCLTFSADSTLWLADRVARTYASFELGAKSALPMAFLKAPSTFSGIARQVLWNSSGTLVHLSDSLSPNGRDSYLIRLELGKSGKPLSRKVLPEPWAKLLPSAVLINRQTDGLTKVLQPFGPRLLNAVGLNGVTAEAQSSVYLISWRDVNGVEIARVLRKVQGPRIGWRERRAAEKDLERLASHNGYERDAIPFNVPDRKAPLLGIVFDRENRLWAELSVPVGASKQADVFDSRGNWLMQVQWPATVRLDMSTMTGRVGYGMIEYSGDHAKVVRVHLALRPNNL